MTDRLMSVSLKIEQKSNEELANMQLHVTRRQLGSDLFNLNNALGNSAALTLDIGPDMIPVSSAVSCTPARHALSLSAEKKQDKVF